MNKEQVVGIAVRLFAIFIVVYILRYFPSLIGFSISNSQGGISYAPILLIGLSPLLIAVVLWRFPFAVARKIIPITNEEPKPIGETEIQVVAFSIIGLWILISAISDIAYWIAYVYEIKSARVSDYQERLMPGNIGAIVSASIQFILGLWLFFGSRGIVGFVRSLRYAGR